MQYQSKPHQAKTPVLNRLSKAILAALVLVGVTATPVQASNVISSDYTSVTFFGDSLTDGGYFQPITQAQGLSNSGQFTTNPDDTWATPFAQQLGLTAIANKVDGSQTGNNYAIGGARSGIDVNRSGMMVDAASTQVVNYLAKNKVDANGLYSLWIGANDLLAVVSDLQNSDSIIEAAVSDEINTIKQLEANGANYILVPNIPDVGLTPYLSGAGESLQAFGTGLSTKYNEALYSGIKSTGANVIPLDTFRLLQEVAKEPSAYGFSNISGRACGAVNSLECGPDDLVETNANNLYFFADSIHPTGRAHRMIADYANAVVTAPSQIGVLPHIITQSGIQTNASVHEHMNQLQSEQSATTPLRTQGSQVWASADVNTLDVAGFESNGNSQLLLGMDFVNAGAPHAVTGVYANVKQSQLDRGIRTGVNQIDLDELGVGAYHHHQIAGFVLNGTIGYGNIDMDMNRQISLDTYSQQAKSEVDAKRYYASIEAGYPLPIQTVTLTPYVAAIYNRVEMDAISENLDNDALAMQFDEQHYNTTYATYGIKADSKIGDALNVFADLNYQALVTDNRKAVTAQLRSQPDITFTTPLSDIDEDSLNMTLGLSRQFGSVKANAGVSYTVGEDDEATRVVVGLSKAF